MDGREFQEVSRFAEEFRIPNVPVHVAAVIETALSKQVEARWRTAGAMREALLNAAASGS